MKFFVIEIKNCEDEWIGRVFIRFYLEFKQEEETGRIKHLICYGLFPSHFAVKLKNLLLQ